MRRRRTPFVVALIGAAITGGVVAVVVRGGAPAPTVSAPPPVMTATVQRTNLATTVLTEGTLTDAPSAPVVNQIAGTYTQLPQSGASIGFGQTLYRVDNAPIFLMQGSMPAWRPFALGMVDGPDVAELESNLIALGDASGLFSTSSEHFDNATALAIERWQRANGIGVTGQIGLGEITLLPEPVLVAAPNVAAGESAAPGDQPFAVTTSTRVVTVPLNPNLPAVSAGEAVSIVLPTNVRTPGKITSVGSAPASNGSQSSSNDASQSQAASTVAAVTPDDPAATGTDTAVPVQVSLTTQSVNNVLVAPISSLLALSGGGYAVEVVGLAGVHHLVGVTTGLFTGSEVQISGSDIDPGTKIVVAQ